MIKFNILKKTIGLNPVRIIVLAYFIGTFAAAMLFSLPISLQAGVKLSFVDSLFTAVSAISVTGLNVVNTAETFSVFGIFVMMLVLQFGGIGLMTLGTFVYVLLGKNVGLAHRQLIMIDQNKNNLSGLVQTVRLVLSFAIIVELIGAFLFGTYFLFRGYYTSIIEAYYLGLFHSLSSFTNAGFDIFGDSLYRFSNDYFIQIITMLLLILGALGFPVIIEAKAKFIDRVPNFRFSLFTKLTTTTFLMLIMIGALSIFLLERDLFFAGLPWHEKLFHSLFFSVTPRNGGLATLDVNVFSNATLFFLSALMFIGASPSSVGGGIRTTTFAVTLLTIIAFASGKSEVRAFKRSISHEDIIKSMVVVITAIILVFSAVLLISHTEHGKHSILALIFEVSSGFGTTGLSMGITPSLSSLGKYIMIALMFIGRIGILSFLGILNYKRTKDKLHYIEERVIIG